MIVAVFFFLSFFERNNDLPWVSEAWMKRARRNTTAPNRNSILEPEGRDVDMKKKKKYDDDDGVDDDDDS